MMHRAWSSIVEVPFCFSRSYVKFQGHTALKIVQFDPNLVFPDCNSSLNSPMAMKCCTKLETAKERCPIVFQCHPSNFKVTRYKTSPILTQIGHFRTIGGSQLSNSSDLPCLSRTDQKCAESSAFWQFFYYCPPSIQWERSLKCDAKNSTYIYYLISIHIYIDRYRYRYHPLDKRYGFSISVQSEITSLLRVFFQC